jgi:hypothetical protein
VAIRREPSAAPITSVGYLFALPGAYMALGIAVVLRIKPEL